MPTGIENKKTKAAETSLDQITQSLIRVVAREAEYLETLLQLLTRQQRFLVEGDVPAVEQNIQEQERAIRTARELETERCRLLDRLAGHLDGNSQTLTLSRLAEVLAGTYAARLKELRTTLLSITENIQRVRSQNEMLIDRSLFHIGETMRLLAGSAATVPSYSMNPATTKKNAALVNRVG
jgi:flagellar biosynthesis/type III secretory pathway chaperone